MAMNLTIPGILTVNGSDYAERFPVKEVIPKNRFVTLNGESIKLANKSDSYILGVTADKPGVIGDMEVSGIEVGLLGKLWVDHDGTAKVNGYVKCGDNGIATASETGYRVMAVVGEKCRILVK